MPTDDRVDGGRVEYAGFWIRVGAALIDTALVLCITSPILSWVYGSAAAGGLGSLSALRSASLTDLLLLWLRPAGLVDFLLSWVFPAAAVVVFWLARQGTPGKLLLRLRVVDARTGGPLTVGQSIGRYLGYYVSLIPFGLGLIWVGIDARKQGFHDKLAGTVVIRSRRRGPQPVRFEGA